MPWPPPGPARQARPQAAAVDDSPLPARLPVYCPGRAGEPQTPAGGAGSAQPQGLPDQQPHLQPQQGKAGLLPRVLRDHSPAGCRREVHYSPDHPEVAWLFNHRAEPGTDPWIEVPFIHRRLLNDRWTEETWAPRPCTSTSPPAAAATSPSPAPAPSCCANLAAVRAVFADAGTLAVPRHTTALDKPVGQWLTNIRRPGGLGKDPRTSCQAGGAAGRDRP